MVVQLWVEDGMRTWAFTLMAAILVCSGGRASGAEASSPGSACGVAIQAAMHVGETVSFKGTYTSDGRERAIVTPLACRTAFRIWGIPDDVGRLLDPHVMPGMYPYGDVEATFTGVIIQVKPSDAQFYRDDGVRLNIVSVNDLKHNGG